MIQSGVDLDQLLKAYLKGHNAMFRKAPSEISKMMQTICGLALQVPVTTSEVEPTHEYGEKVETKFIKDSK